MSRRSIVHPWPLFLALAWAAPVAVWAQDDAPDVPPDEPTPDAAVGVEADVAADVRVDDAAEEVTAKEVYSAWVKLGGRHVLAIHAGAAGFSLEERARIVSGRISKLARDPAVRSDSITVNEGTSGTEILSGKVLVMTVTDLDAALEGKERRALALDDARVIRTAIEEYRRDFSLKVIFLACVWSLLATGVLIAWFFLLKKLISWSTARIDSWRGRWIRSITIQRHVILPADRIAAGIAGFLRITLHTLSVVVIYFYLNLVLSFFPWTRGFASRLLGFLVSLLLSVWHAIVSYSPNLAVIAVIAVVTWYLLGFVKPFFGAIAKGTISFPGFPREWAEPTRRIARILVVAVAVVVAIPFLPGAGSLALEGIAVFLAALLIVGSASSVSSAFAGIVLVYMRAYAEGDRGRIGDVAGEVVERSLLLTRLRTAGNEEVTIPNAIVLKSRIVNSSAMALERGVPVEVLVTVGRAASRAKAEQIMLAVATASAGLRKDPGPFVRFEGMGDDGVYLRLTAFAMDPDDLSAVGSGLMTAIMDAMAAGGIEVSSLGHARAADGDR